MNTLPKLLENKTKIRFQDCDPFNHLNNGAYLNYFMNHREDVLLKNYNIDIFSLAKATGKGWVSSSNQIAYLKPVFLAEIVTIESQLIKYTESDLIVEMRMHDEGKSELKCVIWASLVYFNFLEQKRETHSENFMALFKNVNNPIEINTFEERVKQLKYGLAKTV
jgi:acyl-CoA thioester hydrolase